MNLSAAICHVDAFVSPRPSADGAHYRDPAPSSIPSAERSEDVNGQRQSCAPDASPASTQP